MLGTSVHLSYVGSNRYLIDLFIGWKEKEFGGEKGDFSKMHWKITLFLTRLKTSFSEAPKNSKRNLRGICFIQNFSSFLMDQCIFTVSAILLVKNADEVAPLEIKFSEVKILTGSSFLAFFTHKTILTVKIKRSTRNLVKFWTK